MDSFSNTFNRFKKWDFATVWGAFAPRTPCAGRVIALKWPGRPTCPKNLTGPLYCDHQNRIIIVLIKKYCSLWNLWTSILQKTILSKTLSVLFSCMKNWPSPNFTWQYFLQYQDFWNKERYLGPFQSETFKLISISKKIFCYSFLIYNSNIAGRLL